MSIPAAAHAERLATAGVVGPDGPDLDAMERLIAARGWSCCASPSTTSHGRPGRWRATVFAPGGATYGGRRTFIGARGAGRTEAEALAEALGNAPARTG